VASVQLQGIYKRYGEIETIHGVDLEIRDGEFLVLVGPSGCGKSTLLRMIAGLEDITDGTLRIADRKVNEVAPRDRGVAMVFQSYALYPHMTVEDNMGFALKIRRVGRAAIAERTREVAEMLDLVPYLSRFPKELSGGQRQRVAIGRAIVRSPDVFLFDEPLSNLDAALRNQMRIELKKLHARLGTTMIYVTHDQIEAMTLADRIAILKDGVVQQIGTPQELYTEPANRFVAHFVGSPPMNFLAVTYDPDQRAFVSDDLKLPAAASQETIHEIGVRPQDLSVGKTSSGRCQLVVDVVEPMGWEMHVHGHVGRQPITLHTRMEASENVLPGDVLDLSIDLERVHLFGENGQRIQHAALDHPATAD
jgi:multiple sugar transport system ATP-binding protein